MQTIHKNKDERGDGRRTDSIGIVVCTGRVSEYIERKYVGRLGGKRNGI